MTFPTCTKFKGVTEAESTDEQLRAREELCGQRRGDPEPTSGSGRERPPEEPRRPRSRPPGAPAPGLPRGPDPRRPPDAPAPLRLLRRVPAPGSLVRAGAPLTRREGIYVAALVTAYGREEVGTTSRPRLRSGAAAQQPGAAPAATPRCARQL